MVSHKIVMTEKLQKKSSDKTLLKDIWQKHTEVQEQILRQRTAQRIFLVGNLSFKRIA